MGVTMDKQEFISKLMVMYPSQFAGSACDDWVKEYEIALTAPYQISYDKMWDLIRDEWQYSTTPKPSWFKENLPRCKEYDNPIFDRYVDIKLEDCNDIYTFTITERELLKLKMKGKKYTIVTGPYRMGG